MSISGTSSITNLYSIATSFKANQTRGEGPDPAKMAEEMSRQVIEQLDSDGDGALSSTEATGVSEETFATVDTDADGLLSTSELATVAQDQMDAIHEAFEMGGAEAGESAINALLKGEDGEFMQMLMPDPPPEGQGPPPPQQDIGAYQEQNDLWSSLLDSLKSEGSDRSSVLSSFFSGLSNLDISA